MDPNDPLVQILQQINELSGAALDALLNGGGAPADQGAAPSPEPTEAPA